MGHGKCHITDSSACFRRSRLVVHHVTMARVVERSRLSWNTANDAVLLEGRYMGQADSAPVPGGRVHVPGLSRLTKPLRGHNS